ncbi:MAG: nucleoside deaminase [Acidimicrobiia bacterium]|nr:nucleoside deaminase [Acidimicrobiia bacterium]
MTAGLRIPMAQLDHERFMRRAIALTANCPGLPFGAVIVRGDTGEVLAEGWNKSTINPTWHGEIDAINRLVDLGHGDDRSGLVLYSTAEPCPMCAAAILWSGVGTVVFGSSIRFLVQCGWRQINIPAADVVRRSPGWSCAIIGGVLERECNDLFQTPPGECRQ